MYDPTTARWLSQDPLGFDAGDENLYRYVHNQPTMYTDPSGLVTLEGAWNWVVSTGQHVGTNVGAAWSAASHWTPLPNVPQALGSAGQTWHHLTQGNFVQAGGHYLSIGSYLFPFGSHTADAIVSVTDHGFAQTGANYYTGTMHGLSSIFQWLPLPNWPEWALTGDQNHSEPYYTLNVNLNNSAANYQQHGYGWFGSWAMAVVEQFLLTNAGLGVVENLHGTSLHSANFGETVTFEQMTNNYLNFQMTAISVYGMFHSLLGLFRAPGIGSQAVMPPGFGRVGPPVAGWHPALQINGRVYVHHMHNAAQELAGIPFVQGRDLYGMVRLNANGVVVEARWAGH